LFNNNNNNTNKTKEGRPIVHHMTRHCQNDRQDCGLWYNTESHSKIKPVSRKIGETGLRDVLIA